MKKSHVVLIVIASALAGIFVFSNFFLILGGIFLDIISGSNADIEIDSYRLCETKEGDDVIVIKYLLKNNGKEPTALLYEGDFYVYQNGVSLTECIDELPKECDYDTQDQYKNIKGGVEYYAEIAYYLESPDSDVEVEVNDYGLFDDKEEKVFSLK